MTTTLTSDQLATLTGRRFRAERKAFAVVAHQYPAPPIVKSYTSGNRGIHEHITSDLDTLTPYRAIWCHHDSHTRRTHKALTRMGLSRTNVFHESDPVFKMFESPWDFGCRCWNTRVSVREAAAMGVAEARRWLRTGKEPQHKHVPMPPFRPDPEYVREGPRYKSIEAETKSFVEQEHPRGQPENPGQFAKKPGRGKPAKESGGKEKKPVQPSTAKRRRLRPTRERAFNGEPVDTVKISKQEAGKIGEEIILSFLISRGRKDARPMNSELNNFPIDLIQDHETIEVKTGQVSNSKGAQQWRLTIGEPGKEEKARLAKMTPEEKYVWNEKKQRDIVLRKERVLKEVSEELGRPVKAATMTVLLDPGRKVADVYRFPGFHQRIAWTSEEAQKAYVGSFVYE